MHHSFAGALHGGVDFFTHSAVGLGSIFNTVAINWTGLEESVYSGSSYNELTTNYLNRFDNWFSDTLHVDRDNALYQTSRFLTSTSLEVSSLAMGGYGLVKGGIHLAKGGSSLAGCARISQQAEIAGGLASGELSLFPKGGVDNYRALSSKSGADLNRHLRNIEKYGTGGTKKLQNGCVRYFGNLDLATKHGPMAGKEICS